MSRRKQRRGPPTCNDCGAPITFKLSPFTGKPRPFDPNPVDPRRHIGDTAFPVESGKAWKLEEFVEELMGRTQQSHDDAADEARAYPWYVPHRCRTAGAENESEEP